MARCWLWLCSALPSLPCSSFCTFRKGNQFKKNDLSNRPFCYVTHIPHMSHVSLLFPFYFWLVSELIWSTGTDLVLLLSQVVLWDISAHLTQLQASGKKISDTFVSNHILCPMCTIMTLVYYNKAISYWNSFSQDDVSMVSSSMCSQFTNAMYAAYLL